LIKIKDEDNILYKAILSRYSFLAGNNILKLEGVKILFWQIFLEMLWNREFGI
jgi:hypothetical protein